MKFADWFEDNGDWLWLPIGIVVIGVFLAGFTGLGVLLGFG